MKPQIRKDPSDGDWLLSHPGAPYVPIATVMHRHFPTWPDAIRACDQWYAAREIFEAVETVRSTGCSMSADGGDA